MHTGLPADNIIDMIQSMFERFDAAVKAFWEYMLILESMIGFVNVT